MQNELVEMISKSKASDELEQGQEGFIENDKLLGIDPQSIQKVFAWQ